MMMDFPRDLFSVNKNSIAYIFKLIVDQRQGFKPTTRAVLKELVNIELRDIPFDGSITERYNLIKTTTDELIEKYIKEGKLEVIDKENTSTPGGGDEPVTPPDPEEPGETVTEVTTEEDLKQAILNEDKEIKLADNIIVATGNLDLGKVKHFNGNGKTITFNSVGQNLVSTNSGTTIENITVENTVADENWSSTYGVQCYNGTYTLKNVTIKGGNAGILVNSANVTLEGTIDVSGNKFGGIEVSKSSNPVLPDSVLNINGATIINTTEEYGKPTIWTDGEGATVNGVESMFSNPNIKENQVQYYLKEENSEEPAMEVTDVSGIQQAVEKGFTNIKLANNISVDDYRLDITGIKHFNGNGKTIIFSIPGQNLVSTTNGTTIENVTIENINDNQEWNSTYGIQCYNGNYIIKNCKVNGCNGGILINSSNVVFEGTIDVSGNTFGGIEVSKSNNEGMRNSTLNINGASLINTTEEYGKPTIWTDGEGQVVIGADSMFTNSEVKEDQVQYYLREENSII